jgi:hypothetical protein
MIKNNKIIPVLSEESNTVSFKIFTIDCLNNPIEPIENKTFIFNLNEKIADIKNKILDNIFDNKFNYLDLENITERVYKDYGKLFFEKGVLPTTIDNYKLSEFTLSDRIFSFVVYPRNIEVKKQEIKKTFITKYAQENIGKGGFILRDEDFPPLK